MKHLNYSFIAVATLLTFSACSTELEMDEQFLEIPPEIREITVTLPVMPVIDDAETRSALVYKPDGDTFGFEWSSDDVLGVYPDAGSQIDFPINPDDVGKNTAHFDGGGWALKSGSYYSLYYPYNYSYTDKTAIPLDYRGQKQVSKNDFTHLFSYNYFSSKNAVRGNASGELNFSVGYLGTIYWMPFTMPEAATLTKLRLVSSNVPFMQTAYLNISGEVPSVYPATESKTVTLTLDNLEVSAGELVNFYMWVLPRDFTSGTITAEIVTSDRIVYTTDVTPSVPLEAGSYRRFKRGASGQKPITKKAELEPETINFEDANVKAICVENWDTNDDGELDMAEAAAVNYLNDAFAYNKEIYSFEELQYFTGLDVIDHDAFSGCTSLYTIQIPEGVTTIGTNAFENCTDLYEIDLPESVTTICDFAFGNCTNLYHVTMPGVTTIGVSAFVYTSLRDFTLSPVLEEIGSNAFSHVTGLSTLTLPATLTSIGDYAFEFSSLSYVNLEFDEEDNVKDYVLTTIPEGAFAYCANLQYLNIPSSVTTIERVAFLGCTAMHNIDLPSGLEAIGEGAFESTSLVKIDIPETVTELGSFAFWVDYDCLQYIIWRNPIQINSESIFTYNDSPIYVPQSMVKQTKEWYPDYAHRIKSIESMDGGGEGSTTATMPDLNISW